MPFLFYFTGVNKTLRVVGEDWEERKRKNCHARDLVSFVASKSMGYKFNEIAEILDIHPVTVGRCAEKGRKLVDRYQEIWDTLCS